MLIFILHFYTQLKSSLNINTIQNHAQFVQMSKVEIDQNSLIVDSSTRTSSENCQNPRRRSRGRICRIWNVHKLWSRCVHNKFRIGFVVRLGSLCVRMSNSKSNVYVCSRCITAVCAHLNICDFWSINLIEKRNRFCARIAIMCIKCTESNHVVFSVWYCSRIVAAFVMRCWCYYGFCLYSLFPRLLSPHSQHMRSIPISFDSAAVWLNQKPWAVSQFIRVGINLCRD